MIISHSRLCESCTSAWAHESSILHATWSIEQVVEVYNILYRVYCI